MVVKMKKAQFLEMKSTAEHCARIHDQLEEKVPELQDRKGVVDISGILLVTKEMMKNRS